MQKFPRDNYLRQIIPTYQYVRQELPGDNYLGKICRGEGVAHGWDPFVGVGSTHPLKKILNRLPSNSLDSEEDGYLATAVLTKWLKTQGKVVYGQD